MTAVASGGCFGPVGGLDPILPRPDLGGFGVSDAALLVEKFGPAHGAAIGCRSPGHRTTILLQNPKTADRTVVACAAGLLAKNAAVASVANRAQAIGKLAILDFSASANNARAGLNGFRLVQDAMARGAFAPIKPKSGQAARLVIKQFDLLGDGHATGSFLHIANGNLGS